MIKPRILGGSYYYESDDGKLLRNKETGEVRESWLVGLDKPLDLEEADKDDVEDNK